VGIPHACYLYISKVQDTTMNFIMGCNDRVSELDFGMKRHEYLHMKMNYTFVIIFKQSDLF
jgi:hypothetical protein